MKKGMLLLLLIGSVFAHGQSLKEALYGGKLKNTPGTVIRKGDDLTAQMDTTRKTATGDTVVTKVTPLPTDSSAQTLAIQTDSAALSTISETDTLSGSTDTAASETAKAPEAASTPAAVAAPKDNNAVWKEYVNTVIPTLKTEVLPSKKIKKGSYYVLVSYTIDTDGQAAVSDVFLSPENSFLQQQIKERLDAEAPRLNPVLNSSGTPRKVNKKYNFTLSKE